MKTTKKLNKAIKEQKQLIKQAKINLSMAESRFKSELTQETLF